jgi:glycolate oxidase FAD binding subunit
MPASATITRDQALEHLASISGPDHTQLSGDAIRVAPASPDQVAAVLRFASEHSLSVVPTSSATKLAWGNPVTPEIVLSLQRMNAVVEHAWQDLTCTVQVGCTWAKLQSELARHGQMVALDPLWPDRATVGGIVATNDSGALRLRYGGLRDLIIGMTIVLADGTIAKSGGKVVKNVAGYDLHKLLTGSFGTLGVITQVNFRLHPVEQHARTFTATAQYATQLAQPLADLLHAQLAPSAIQLRTAVGQCMLDVRLCARPECLDDHAAQLRAIFSAHALAEVDDSVWQAREHLFSSPAATIVKVSMLPAELCATADAVKESSVAEGIDFSIVAQATGLAVIALNDPPAAASDAPRHSSAIASIIDHIRTRLRPTGGSAVILQLPVALRNTIDVWDCRSDAMPLMREIKRRFDPQTILSPGRFVGGI